MPFNGLYIFSALILLAGRQEEYLAKLSDKVQLSFVQLQTYRANLL